MTATPSNSVSAVTLLVCAFLSVSAGLRAQERGGPALDPAAGALPALGAPSDRKVDIAWNRFYDHAGLATILARLQEAFPDLAVRSTLGKSTEGRDIWCLEVTARRVGHPDRKPGMFIDGNIHGNEVQAGEVVAYTAWYLCHQYGRLERITQLLDDYVFYLVPMVNPDGRDFWLHSNNGAMSARGGSAPTDNDRDGVADEDDCEDLNGDGVVTMMRIKDPQGRWKRHPDYPESLMVRAKPDEPGEYTLLGWEGIDNDGDGRVNEDGRGGYDMNRNFPYDWQPNYIQFGARDYPLSQPETRAVVRFVLAHPNIVAAQCYHNSGGMILRGPGHEGGAMKGADGRLLETIGRQGERILPYYRSIISWKDLYTTWGDEDTWLYAARGVLAYTNELWTPSNLYRKEDQPSDEDEAEFVKHVLLGEGVVPWRAYDHPTYGAIELGGQKKEWGRVPPSFLLEEELHRNMAFTLYHAGTMPRLRISDVSVEPLGGELFRIWVTVENQHMVPTRTAQDVDERVSPPDIVSLRGEQIQVVSAGRVLDRFFKRVEAVEARPQRVELETIGGMDAVRVQFIAKGTGGFTVTVDSAKGGWLQRTALLPTR